MSSDRRVDLCLEVRRESNLWSAWSHVRKSALSSNAIDTRKEAQRIDANPASVLRRLQRALQNDIDVFEPQRGVLKHRAGKTPRPLVIAPVRNRIAQRAVLQILQSEQERIAASLGRLPDVLRSEGSVGGVPGFSSSDAVRIIQDAAGAGMTHYFCSDIRSFFTDVGIAPVVDLVRTETDSAPFSSLFEAALQVELFNGASPGIREWSDLFPDGKVGVAQGCSLSAFCANVTLREFDKSLRSGETTAVRYIDDFVVLGKSERAVGKAVQRGLAELDRLGLTMWKLEDADTKASSGLIRQGFDFLSYHFDGMQVGIARTARSDLLNTVRSKLKGAAQTLSGSFDEPRHLSNGGVTRTLQDLDRMLWGWAMSFGCVTRVQQLESMDNVINQHVRGLVGECRRKTGGLSDNEYRRALGVTLLADIPRLR